jgi:hypothetical protein
MRTVSCKGLEKKCYPCDGIVACHEVCGIGANNAKRNFVLKDAEERKGQKEE